MGVEERKQASDLIFKLLAEFITSEQALKHFPKDLEDKTLQCAFQALLFYDADEELRFNDNEFGEEQKNYLEYIANVLRIGDDLPQNIIDSYDYKLAEPITEPKTLKEFLKKVFKFTI